MGSVILQPEEQAEFQLSVAVKGLGGQWVSSRCMDGGLFGGLAEEEMSVNTTDRPSGQSRTLESASHLVVLLAHRASAGLGLRPRPPGDRTSVFTTDAWLILISMSSDCLRLSSEALITFLALSSSSSSLLSMSSSSSSSVSVAFSLRPPSSLLLWSPIDSVESLFTDRSRGPSLCRAVRSKAWWMWESSLRILLRCSQRCLWAGRSSFSRWEILRSASWYSCSALERSPSRAATDSDAPIVLVAAESWLLGLPQVEREDVSLVGLVRGSLYHSSVGRPWTWASCKLRKSERKELNKYS